MKAMEKINAVVKAAQASKDDAIHKLGIALEGIANSIASSVSEIKAAKSDAWSDITVWYLKGRLDAYMQAFKSFIICSPLSTTQEGKEALKVRANEVEYYA